MYLLPVQVHVIPDPEPVGVKPELQATVHAPMPPAPQVEVAVAFAMVVVHEGHVVHTRFTEYEHAVVWYSDDEHVLHGEHDVHPYPDANDPLGHAVQGAYCVDE